MEKITHDMLKELQILLYNKIIFKMQIFSKKE
jgi:hypothetical protein